jgi:hypothetical protein
MPKQHPTVTIHKMKRQSTSTLLLLQDYLSDTAAVNLFQNKMGCFAYGKLKRSDNDLSSV